MADPVNLRARRLLALLHTLKPGTEVRLSKLAEAFDTDVAQLTRDLELLSCCGVSQHGDELVPIYVEDGVLVVFNPLPALGGAVRLSASEAHALIAALQAAGLGADDDLVRTLVAGSVAADIDAEQVERVVRSAATSGQADALKQVALALEKRRVVQLRYQNAGAQTASTRDVEPLALVNERGVWYLEAYCRKAEGLRTFRVDRITEALVTTQSFEPRGLAIHGRAFVATDLPVATVRLDAGQEFSTREWPGAKAIERHDDGTLVVEVPYAGTGWVARQIVARLGAAQVVGPAEVRAAVAELAKSL